jgi:hypothetical protein
MWQIYYQFGWHSIRNLTDEQFEDTKKFYKLFETAPDFYQNRRGDIYAWKLKGATENGNVAEQ